MNLSTLKAKQSLLETSGHFFSSTSFQMMYGLILSAACFGLGLVMTKSTLTHLPPLLLLVIQTSASSFFLWTITVTHRIRVPCRWQTWRAGLAGLLEPGLSYLLGTLGLSLTTASNASLISTLEPLMTLGLSWLLLRERMRWQRILFAGVACGGVICVASTDPGTTNAGSLLGDCLLILGVMCASLYGITNRQLVTRLDPVVVAAVQQTVALVWFIALWGIFGGSEGLAEFSPGIWLQAILSGVLGSGLAFWLYLSALRHQSASTTSLYLTLIPLFGVIAAFFFLGEQLVPFQGFGALLILAAVVGVSKDPIELRQKS